jgi:hypothetical protein
VVLTPSIGNGILPLLFPKEPPEPVEGPGFAPSPISSSLPADVTPVHDVLRGREKQMFGLN